MKLVKIEGLEYSAYSGKTLVHKIRADQPLEPEFVEYFRKFPEKVVSTIFPEEPGHA